MLLSLSNRKYPPFPLLFFRGCVPEICLLHHIVSLIAYTFRKTREFVFVTIEPFMMSANSRIRSGWQILFVCLYITPSHHLSSLCKLIWRHWTYKIPVRYIFSSVWIKLSILSVFHYELCETVCFQFTHLLCDDWENIYTLSYYHNQIGSMKYYPL